MPYVIISILIQIFCAVHVIRSGRNSMWIMVIAFFSLIGCAAYFALEIMPTLGSNRHVRLAKAQAVAKIDPQRALRSAEDQLNLADTVANRIAVGDAHAGLGQHEQALSYFREGLSKSPGDDSQTRLKLAASLFETGAADQALEELDRLSDTKVTNEQDRRLLLRARIFDRLGRKSEAADIYADVVTRLPGEEARCRYAALLLDTGETQRARSILEEVESRMRRLDRTQRAVESDMYDWAIKQLATLRS